MDDGALISEAGDYVEVDYTGTLADGEVFDSSIGSEPLGFVLASGMMIPGFDAAAHGMAVGETKTVTILSEDAYGDWTEDMVFAIPRNLETEEEEAPVAGEYILLFNGIRFVSAIVLEVTDEAMVVDANPQLAGQDLTFEITMKKIVKPDDPEHPSNAVVTDDSSTQEFVIEVPELEATEFIEEELASEVLEPEAAE
jgi:peptidylprolyl isomerase